MADMRSSLKALLAEHPRTSRQIADELGCERKEVTATLKDLVVKGDVKRAGHVYGIDGSRIEPRTPPRGCVRDPMSNTRKTKNYNPSSPISRRRKRMVLSIMKDGKWRSRREISGASSLTGKRLEYVVPDLVRSGDLTKVGEECRDPQSRWNRVSDRNRGLLDLLARPILEASLHERCELPACTLASRLRLLESQGLAVSREVFVRSTRAVRQMRFWCAVPRPQGSSPSCGSSRPIRTVSSIPKPCQPRGRMPVSPARQGTPFWKRGRRRQMTRHRNPTDHFDIR